MFIFNKYYLKNIGVTIIIFGTSLAGCKKFIEVDAPYTSINSNNVYSTDATAVAAITSLYTKMGTADGGIGSGIQSITYNAGLSADELIVSPSLSAGILIDLNRNNLVASSAPTHWAQLFQQIYIANAAIEGLDLSTTLTPSIKKQLLGESKFMRAFCLFYLVNLYGDVPLAVTTGYKINSLMPRTPAADVWKQIISDLQDAKDLLSASYLGPDLITSTATTERLRPNKWTASALLSRAFLYTGDYMKAETEATAIINNTLMFSLSSLANTFLKNPSLNKEAIWQIQPITTGWNTNDARIFILPVTGPNSGLNPVSLSKRLVYDFEPNDARKANWVTGIKVGTDSFYYSYKYRSATLNVAVTEYNTVFRLAEQYLIRAEAKAMQNKFQEAIDDVNTIRLQHGGLSIPLAAPSSQSQVLGIILHERRVELFCEWGHRWLDLKRTNTVDAIMSIESPLKGGSWESTDKLYPISLDELQSNPNLRQTPGY